MESTKLNQEQEQRYYLQGFIVGKSENDGRYYWGTYVTWAGLDHGKDLRDFLSGKAWLENDTYIMSPWKCDQESDLTTDEELKECMSALPVWDKSKYYIKMGDIGDSGLMDCKTGEPVTDEKILNEIMPKLGYTSVKSEKETVN